MPDQKQVLLRYLQSKRLMQLATANKNPWICTIYYTIDEEFNIYFLSNQKTKHCQDILKNPNVACAITDSHQKVLDDKIGVQIEGTAIQVQDQKEIKKAVNLWNQANPGVAKILSFSAIFLKLRKERVFKVQPTKIKFFNEALFGAKESKTITI